MITLKTNMVTTGDYYSLALTIYCMKLKRKIHIKISTRTKKCLILAIFLLIQNIVMIQTNKLLVR